MPLQSCTWPDGTTCCAIFSADERHRYLLSRSAPTVSSRYVTFLMLNPSTATHKVSDPTVTRCANFARSWGYRSIRVVNLFSLRATDPRALRSDLAPDGGDANDMTILLSAYRSDVVVCAWGVHGTLRRRAEDVLRMLRLQGLRDKLRCLGVTKDGHPKHPLYLAADTPLIPFGPRAKGVA